jgi:hypothetical protein
MLVSDPSPRLVDTDEERTLERVVSVGVVVGAVATLMAGATIVLVLTDPVSLTNAVGSGALSTLALQLVGVIYDAITGLLEYL